MQPKPVFSPRQSRDLLQANSRWNLLIGATRSGKTYLQYFLIPKRVLEQPKTGLCVLLANTLGNVETNLLEPMRELYGGGYVSPMHRRAGVNYANVFGREMICIGANDIKAVNRLRGKKIIYLAGDEGPTWPNDVMQILKTRFDDPRAKADITGNPEGPSHPFKKDLIDRADELGVYYSHYTLDDNIFLDPAVKEQLKKELTGVWYKRLVLGLWVAAEGAVYDMLDVDRHVVDDDKLPLLVQDRNAPSRPYFAWLAVGSDYGTASVTTFWLVGLGSDKRLYAIDFWRHDVAKEFRQLTDREVCEKARAWLKSLGVTPRHLLIPPDAASLIEEMSRSRMKDPGGPLRGLAVADQSPDSVLNGIRTVGGLLATDRLLFARRIHRAGGLDEWLGYSWDPKAQALGEDKPLKENDHSPDAVRHAIYDTRALWQNILR